MATEVNHKLDIVLDVKKPHQTWIEDILTLYRSALLYSNGKYKIITERNDLPIRQVFHSGNMVAGKTEVRMGGDPLRINQLTTTFANQSINFAQDIYILPDSTAIYVSGDPVKPADMALFGLTRRSEVARRTDIEMQKRRLKLREINFQTGMEAVAVEPGDMCIVGVVMTDFEMGWGGRVMAGSTNMFVADREVQLRPGVNYDLWVWHTAADTAEQRRLIGSATQIGIYPTSNFTYPCLAQDRWAIGVQSEDLLTCMVKKVAIGEDGMIGIIAEEFIPIRARAQCPSSVALDPLALGFDVPPSHPASVSMTFSQCVMCFQLTYVSCQGGLTSSPSSNFVQIRLQNSIHPPVNGALIDEVLQFVSGPASGQYTSIWDWKPFSAALASYYTFPTSVGSGTAYRFLFDVDTAVRGFSVEVNTGGGFIEYERFVGNSGCVLLEGVGTGSAVRVRPYGPSGVQAQADGCWTFSLASQACLQLGDGNISSPGSISISSQSNLIAATFPGCMLTVEEFARLTVVGLINEFCVQSEATRVAFGLSYAGSTVINSLVINLRKPDDVNTLGQNQPFNVEARFDMLTVPSSSVICRLKYSGPQFNGTQVTTELISQVLTAVNVNVNQPVAIFAKPFHTDTLAAVHSHGCFSIVTDHAEFQSGT